MREELGARGAWVLVGVLFALVAINLPELGSDPWRFRPGERRGRGPAGPAGAGGGRGVRPRHPARQRVHGRASVRRGGDLAARRAPAAPAGLGRGGARAGGRRAAHRTGHAAAAWAARLDRALVLHQRLDLPGRARRRAAAGARQPVRPRLPALGPGALLHARRQRLRSACSTARWRSSTSPTSPARWRAPRSGACCPSLSTTTGCSCSSATSPCWPRRWRSAGRSPCAWRSARCSCAARSPSARPGSARTTRPACCCWCWPSRSPRGAASAGPPRAWPGRSCSSSSPSWRCPSSR